MIPVAIGQPAAKYLSYRIRPACVVKYPQTVSIGFFSSASATIRGRQAITRFLTHPLVHVFQRVNRQPLSENSLERFRGGIERLVDGKQLGELLQHVRPADR